MANWSGFTLTNVGADLQAKINAGLTTLKFTKVGVGSGSGSGSVNALTAMVHKEQDIGIGNVEANGNIVTINFTLTNKGLGSAYQMRELGLFATDPDVGEILFAYMTDNTPDTMPADGSATVVSQDITLNITFSNTGNVSATIDTGAFVTHQDLNTHNTDSSSHEDIRQMFNNYLSRDETETELTTHNTATDSHQPILNAIKAITGTSAYDIAPSKTIAAIIPLLGLGGIVAQKLDNNGYVKFANGFTIQWGYANIDLDDTHKITTLPIAFKDTNYRVIATPAAYTSDTYFYSYKWNDKDSTTTQIQFEMRQNNGAHSTAGLVYVAVGVA